MYIANIHIENFRNFLIADIPLKPFTIVVGKNDTGKTNLFEALNILLYNSKGNYYSKSLSKYDFNTQCINAFVSKMNVLYESMKDNFDTDSYVTELIKNAPNVVIRLRFEDAKSDYERSLLRDWINGDEEHQYFEIEYNYYLKDTRKLRRIIEELKNDDLLDERKDDFQLFLECYDYSLKSTNNDKNIDFSKIKNFVANTISADRDYFSSGDTSGAAKVVANIIESSLIQR